MQVAEERGDRPGAVSIEPLRPFRLDLSVSALRRRARNAVDTWDGATYRRVLANADTVVGCAVTQTGGPEAPRLWLALAGDDVDSRVAGETRETIARTLGAHVDLSDFYRMAEADDRIASLVKRFRGLRPPRFPTLFEGLVNAVACQQLSLEAGLSLLNRLAASRGRVASVDGLRMRAFPRAMDLAGVEPRALRELGFSGRKATTIVELARAVVDGRLDLEGLERFDDADVVSRLTGVRGIGRWSAEYLLLRGFGRLNVFPGDDVGARNNLARWLGLQPPLDHAAVGRAVARWQPFAGMIYFHLLLERLDPAGEADGSDRGSG